MSITKLKNGKYKAEVYLGKGQEGKVRKTKTFVKEKDAKKWERSITTQYGSGALNLDSSMVLSDYLDYWYNTYAVSSTKFYTQKRYKRLLQQVKDRIGYLKLTELRTPVIDRMYADLKTQTQLANGTILKIHRVLRQSLEQAVAWDMIMKNPASYAKPPKDDVRDIKSWSIEDAKLYFENAEESQVKLPAFIVYHTGLREGEVAALRWDDIDFDDGLLHVRHNLVNKGKGILELDEPKTESSQAPVAMTESLIRELKRIQIVHKKHKLQTNIDIEFVCGWLDGRPLNPNYISKAFRNSVEKVNLKTGDKLPVITFHGLRHTHASILYDSGASSHEISKRLRHSRVSTTDDIYIHMTEQKKKDTANVFEEAIKKTAK